MPQVGFATTGLSSQLSRKGAWALRAARWVVPWPLTPRREMHSAAVWRRENGTSTTHVCSRD